jgi:hypothetical protein
MPAAGEDPDAERAALRAAVEERYDFERFGAAEMAEMDLAEWEAAFDPEHWVTGEQLLDRIERELTARVALREIFGMVERHADPDRVIAYSDEGYAVVRPDGSVEGSGTIVRDVEPSVALCSIPEYEVLDVPDRGLPQPEDVTDGTGALGTMMLQVVAAIHLLVGVVLIGAWVLSPGVSSIIAPVAGLGFLLVGGLLFLIIANARLSDRFRAEQYRNRLRALGEVDPGSIGGEDHPTTPRHTGGEREG